MHIYKLSLIQSFVSEDTKILKLCCSNTAKPLFVPERKNNISNLLVSNFKRKPLYFRSLFKGTANKETTLNTHISKASRDLLSRNLELFPGLNVELGWLTSVHLSETSFRNLLQEMIQFQ